MELTQKRILILCELAQQGARDDAGREFVHEITAALMGQWQLLEEQVKIKQQEAMEAVIKERIQAAEDHKKEKIKSELSNGKVRS